MHAARDLTIRRRTSGRSSRRILATSRGSERDFAESYLQIARLLLAYGRTELARRRLKRVVDKFGNTPAAAESRSLLTAMDSRPEAAPAEEAPLPASFAKG